MAIFRPKWVFCCHQLVIKVKTERTSVVTINEMSRVCRRYLAADMSAGRLLFAVLDPSRDWLETDIYRRIELIRPLGGDSDFVVEKGAGNGPDVDLPCHVKYHVQLEVTWRMQPEVTSMMAASRLWYVIRRVTNRWRAVNFDILLVVRMATPPHNNLSWRSPGRSDSCPLRTVHSKWWSKDKW